MEKMNQGRLWGLRNKGAEIILHEVSSNLPTLYNRKKDADSFVKMCADQGLDGIEPIEVIIVRDGVPDKRMIRIYELADDAMSILQGLNSDVASEVMENLEQISQIVNAPA